MPPWVLERLRNAAFVLAERSLAIMRAGELVTESLRAEGIAHVVTKGPGIANVSGGIVERPFSDLDILVSAADFRGARGLLGVLGYREKVEDRQPWTLFDTACREAVNLRLEPHGSIDLHHHVPPWLWGQRITAADLIRAGVAGPPPAAHLTVLPPEENLLIVALHVVSDHGRPGATLMAWRDLLVLAAASDADAVADLAARYCLAGWLRWLVDQYPPEIRPDNLRRALIAPATRSQRVPHPWRLRHLLPPSFSSRHLVGHALRLPAHRAILYLAGMAVPSPSFLQESIPDRRFRYIGWWRAGLAGVIHAGFGSQPADARPDLSSVGPRGAP